MGNRHEKSEFWIQQYKEAVKHGRACLKKIKGIISAYNTNVDAIVRIKPEHIKFLEGLFPEITVLEKVQKGLKNPPGVINTISDFLIGLICCMQTGTGAEWLIQSEDVFKWLLENFQPEVTTLGGQAGLVGNALAVLGVSKVYLHTTSLSPLQISTLPEFGIRIPVEENNHIVFKSPKEAINPDDAQYVHFIFEFLNGTKISVGKSEIIAPKDNRFIATFDPPNVNLEINQTFITAIKSIIDQIDMAMVAGFHLLKRQYPDGSTYEDRLQAGYNLILEWKKKLNPQIRIHLEQGSMQDALVRKGVLEALLPHIDGFGVNEDELLEILVTFGYEKIAEELKKEYNATRIFEGAKKIFDLFNIPRMTVHTRHFSLSLLRTQYGIKSKIEQLAMLLGAATAAMRAYTGKFLSLDEIDKFFQAIDSQPRKNREYPKISQFGLEQIEDLAKLLSKISRTSKEEFLKTGIASFSDFYVIFAVSLIVEDPKAIVGLGDSFTAGLLFGESSNICSINSH
ncbi:MAG: ADP-dependent glucokinase/phosphofructokinase [Promethearchaeota archaeon]